MARSSGSSSSEEEEEEEDLELGRRNSASSSSSSDDEMTIARDRLGSGKTEEEEGGNALFSTFLQNIRLLWEELDLKFDFLQYDLKVSAALS